MLKLLSYTIVIFTGNFMWAKLLIFAQTKTFINLDVQTPTSYKNCIVFQYVIHVMNKKFPVIAFNL